jgi:uncharacterized iron-regulated protein
MELSFVRRLIATFLLSLVCSSALAADAAKTCTYERGPFLRMLDKWGQTCGHALCGRIIRTGPAMEPRGKPECKGDPWMAMRDEIQTAVVEGGSVLIGEVHDNPSHHELRSRMALATYASIVMEQIRADQTDGLDKIKNVGLTGFKETSLSEVMSALEWEKSGWSKYNYDPLLRAVLLSRKPVYAGDPSRDLIKAVAMNGLASLSKADVNLLKLDEPLGDKLEEASRKELAEAHCQQSVADMPSIGNMLAAQRYRDAFMADRLAEAVGRHGSAVLFAGNVHVRTDRGVPWYLARRGVGKKTVSIMLIEVEKDNTDLEAYIPRDPEGRPATDYVILTPPSERSNPCR